METMGGYMNNNTKLFLVGSVLSCLFPLQAFALHESPINFPTPLDEEWWNYQSVEIQYCHPVLCPQTGFLAPGARVSGWFDIWESPTIDFGSGPFYADDIYDYGIAISLGYGPDLSSVGLTPYNAYLGGGGTGPATSWYHLGMPTIESGGTLWRDRGYDENGFVDGLIELTALTTDVGGDMGLKYYFNLANNRVDIYAYMDQNPFAVDLNSAILVASTAAVPLPGALLFFASGLGAFMVFAKRDRRTPTVV
jgi:hypothetical protein